MRNNLKMIYITTTNKCIAVHQDVKHRKLYFPKWTTMIPKNCMCLISASGIINAWNANLQLFINESFPQINYKLQSFKIKLYLQKQHTYHMLSKPQIKTGCALRPRHLHQHYWLWYAYCVHQSSINLSHRSLGASQPSLGYILMWQEARQIVLWSIGFIPTMHLG